MQELDDIELLRQYTENDSEEAFGAIVSRHINKVYSVALRQTGNSHQAEEVTQAVFVILAKKARSLSNRVILSGWLYQTARLASVTFLRSEIRRARREQEAHTMQSILNEPAMDETWKQMSPLLDAAMAKLNETDRNAVLLRFFDGKSIKEVGTALGTTEDTAKKRVSRALEKLQLFFAKRGVSSTTAIIAGTISSNSVQAAPAVLTKTVTTLAITKGAVASASTITLIKGALKIMAWTKVKTAIVAGVVVLLAAGIATVGVKEYQEHRIEAWELPPFPDSSVDFTGSAQDKRLRKAPSELRIVPSKYDEKMFNFSEGGGYTYVTANGTVTNRHRPWGAMGVGVSLDSIVRLAFATERIFPESYGAEPVFPESWRTVYQTEIPTRPLYDFISTLNDGSSRPLQELITKKFGITAKWELIETNVLAMRVSSHGLQGFHPVGSLLRSQHVAINNANQRMNYTNGWLLNSVGDSSTFFNSSIDNLILLFEGTFRVPIVNETGLTNRYDYTIAPPQEDPNRKVDGWTWQKAWTNTLSQQFGLELVPTRAAVKMLIVEKAP